MAAFTQEELRKSRCRNGALVTISKVENHTPEEIIINSYLHTDNPVAMELAKKYEYMLLTAKMKPEVYKKKRDELMSDLGAWVRDNGHYREWVDFVYFVHSKSGRMVHILASAYISEIMESWNYISGNNGHHIIGLTAENEPIIVPEYYGDWDIPLHEMHRKYEKGKISMKAYHEFMQTPQAARLSEQEANESLLDIAVLGMVPYINERTRNVYPKVFFPHANITNFRFPRRWKPTEFYVERLRMRKYLLDKKGIKIYLKNAGSWTEVLLMETITKAGQIAMLYRLSNSEGSTYGFYHIQDEYFFSCYKYSDGPEVHYSIENLILELYTEVACGLEIDVKRAYSIKEVEDISDTSALRQTHLFVQYQRYNEKTDDTELKGKRRGGHTQKPHERGPATRKLTGNRTASEEAIERAKEMGIELQEGYTFVKSYSVGGLKEIRKEAKKQS